MNKIDVKSVLRTDARIRPSEAGIDFAKDHIVPYLSKEFVPPLDCDVRDVHPAILISAFFINFIETIHRCNPDLVVVALKSIKWTTRHVWQANNIDRWMAPYKEKLLSDKPEPITDFLGLPDRISNHQDEGDSIMRELRMCPLWKAIQKSIEQSGKNECGLMDKSGDLIHHRGTGAFSLRKVYAYPPGAGEDSDNVVRFVFDVSCWDDEYEREVDANVMLDIPLVFLIEFNQELFDQWVENKHKEQHQRNLESAKQKLASIYQKYPELKETSNESE